VVITVFGLPAAHRPPCYVQDAVDQPGDRGDLMGDEHDGGAVIALVPAEEGDDGLLGGGVEGEQRLVA
jgi:hypothetical protein